MSASRFAAVEPIADAVMYEGYVLYPYRASAIKNQFRWQFGVVAPREYSERSGTDSWHTQTECVLESLGEPRLTVRVRCLQLQRRTLEQPSGTCEWLGCERLAVDGREMQAWDEAVPQDVTVADLAIDDLCLREDSRAMNLPGVVETEIVHASGGERAARITRERWTIAATVRISAERVGRFVKVRLRVENTTTSETALADRETALHRSLLGCHVLLYVDEGRFVSLTDPSPDASAVVSSCVNQHTWPVMAGPSGTRHLMLSAPIILYDYPMVAPESSGDFFDATEIDELLALRVMTMTEQEKREAAATDERASQIVSRTGDQPTADLGRLHGVIRSFEEMLNPSDVPSPDHAVIQIGTATISRGSRVRLAPQKRADSMDMFLAGRIAVVDAVHRDLEDRIYVAVTLEDDPGADLHRAYGRFFYFSPEEVVPIRPETAGDAR
jgi:hypothetical protein